MDFTHSAALVTGGAVRLGAAIVEALAARGCAVVIHYRQSRADAQRLAARVQAAGGRAHILRAQLESPRECARLMRDALACEPGLNVLVNNASLFTKDAIADLDPVRLEREFRVNLFAPMVLTQAFARDVQARRARRRQPGGNTGADRVLGRIVNLVDRRVAGIEAGCAPYLLSKKALNEFTAIAALELAPDFAVNAVAPGAVLPPPGKGDRAVRELAGATPLRHRVLPGDVARAVMFLLEEPGITGQTLFVDSGQHLTGGAAPAAPGKSRRVGRRP